MNIKASKTLTIVSGPNGAGKTTFVKNTYLEYLERGHFLNADIYAEEMNSGDVGNVAVSAGKWFLAEFDARLQKGDSFIIETTLSGKSLLKKIQKARENGFLVRLIFLMISTPWLCDFRVKGRVALGGHNIPEKDIKRRYSRGLQNLPVYTASVDEFELFQANEIPVLIASKSKGASIQIHDSAWYDELMQMAKSQQQQVV